MASLKSIVQLEADSVRDGIAWLIVYRDGKGWGSACVYSDLWNRVWEDCDRETAAEILAVDPNAIALNGYYCGRLGENMTVEELMNGIRWHYQNRRNLLRDYLLNIDV